MKNYEIMGKTQLIREITDLLQKQKKESERAEKSFSTLQRKIEDVNRDMEDRVREEVENRLLKERFLLHESNITVTEELVGNIAHQWRQPLNIVGLTVQKLQFDFERNEVDDDYLNEMVKEVLDVVKQMSRTVQSFRDFMQIDRKKQQFNPTEAVNRVLTFVDGSMKSAGISINLDAGREDLMINGYPNEFCRIILSMLNNSRKILMTNKTENPAISIRLSGRNSRCVVTFHDNGGVIPEQAIDGIFEPHSSAGRPGSGNGMVLHMAKEIIERKMEGKLTANNKEGGVEFRIEL